MSILATISGNVQVSDSVSGTSALQKVLASLTTSGNSFGEVQTATIPASPTSQTLPGSPVNFAYIKNVSVGTQVITVTWTPAGGASNPVVALPPGSALLLCETGAGGGITTLSYQSSASNGLVEHILVA